MPPFALLLGLHAWEYNLPELVEHYESSLKGEIYSSKRPYQEHRARGAG